MKKSSIPFLLALLAFMGSCKYKCDALIPNQVIVSYEKKDNNLTAKNFAITLNENPKANAPLGNIIAKASDDKAPLLYELQNQSRGDALTIDPSTGALKVNKAKLFDYESTENHQITAQCLIKEADKSVKATITITLNDAEDPFVTKWRVRAGEYIIIKKTDGQSGYNFKVDWGDGEPAQSFDDTYTQFDHRYTTTTTTETEYEVTIIGNYPGLLLDGQGAFITVTAWGDRKWKSMQAMFRGCEKFEIIEAEDQPNLSECTNMSFMFNEASNFNGDISAWKTESVTTMESMFEKASKFNGDISAWKTGNVTTMEKMFYAAKKFDQDLAWDVSKVTNMKYMFNTASLFNGDIGSWKTGNVTTMNGMFAGAVEFNQALNWDVKKVEDMSWMFSYAVNFNGDITGWKTDNVKSMDHMFNHADVFNQDIRGWNAQNLEYVAFMFESAKEFSYDISGWTVDKVLEPHYKGFAKESKLTCALIPGRFRTQHNIGNRAQCN